MTTSLTPDAHRRAVSAMFGRIAGWYDFLNHFLSGGVDIWWRRQLLNAAAPAWQDGRPVIVLDLAAGTLDVTAGILRRSPTARVAALDIAAPMLRKGLGKISREDRDRMLPGVADGRVLPLADASVAAVTIAFGIRNIVPRDAAYAEIRRVLVPGGRFCILEFGSGRTRILRGLYNVYLRRILPAMGRIFSGDPEAYRYLAETIERFPDAPSLGRELEAAGFVDVHWQKLTCGIAYVHVGVAPKP
ncbi:ubiquinone/menaquinone biosynthesis methyltransferase [Megalodesulfovibrio gigas]|uniref:Demethylmenaquinone methyltransferase n=1 Tax=Megalodesulfovibrio gigas (strain ATCC 19364 / DSM 1382 / NCIMB 9332 / VKM B-1759) TaxID=1121448 RepID=T2G9H8_MEGG1|nr:ubiquinone/menaquinone biosynthesis methyltransferase [Megalodesulfovibrio gigas]AGW13245.1 putative ubiquinone/menaquinone biosynthesis methyltransferase [Megalodesulfovibrio gigas DSM 1382 = ATCC 19364]